MKLRTGVLLFVMALAWTGPVEALDVTGRAGIGASGGAMKFLSGQDFKEGSARLIGHAVFKYHFTSHIAAIAETGWGWNAYTKGEFDSLAVVVPTIFGLEYRWTTSSGRIVPRVAGGAGFYWMGIKDEPRKWAKAGDGAELLKWTSFGLFGKLGAEYQFEDGISINLDFLYHQIFSENPDRYTFTKDLPPGDPGLALNNTWGLQNTSFGEIRLGVNYYFSLGGSSPAPPEDEE